MEGSEHSVNVSPGQSEERRRKKRKDKWTAEL
jgi:hypothetical protein